MKTRASNPPSSSATNMATSEKPWFALDSQAMDVSRILASASIFYFHIGLFGSLPFSTAAEKAVEYFIILAGVSYILFSKNQPSCPAQFGDYLKKRWLSLFPVYLLINLGVFFGSFLYTSGLGRHFSVPELLASTVGLSQYIGWRYLTAPMWFVPFIMQVYVLLPLLNWILRRVSPIVVVLSATVISWLLAFWVSVAVPLDQMHLCWICKMWSPLFRLPDVCVGLILGRMMLPGARQRWAGLAAIFLFGLLSWLREFPQPAMGFAIFYLPVEGFVTPLILFGLTFLCRPLFCPLGARFLRLLGRATLPFFLLQCAPLLAVEHVFGHRTLVWLAYFLACWLLAVACTVSLDLATHGFAAIRTPNAKPVAG